MSMRFIATIHAAPMLPESDREDGNPENVTHIKCASCYRSGGATAGKTIVIAECKAFWPEMVGTMNNQHARDLSDISRCPDTLVP